MDEQTSHAGVEGFAAERLACLNLVHAYNNYIDTGHADQVPDVFADDAVLEVGRALTGIDAIRVAMEARAANSERRTTHVTSNVQFTDIGERTATTTSVVLLFVLDADDPRAPAAIIHCKDEFARLDNSEWRFTRRSLCSGGIPQQMLSFSHPRFGLFSLTAGSTPGFVGPLAPMVRLAGRSTWLNSGEILQRRLDWVANARGVGAC
jgi:hypothetical protein